MYYLYLTATSTLCDYECQNNGRCNLLGQCECTQGFYGKRCELCKYLINIGQSRKHNGKFLIWEAHKRVQDLWIKYKEKSYSLILSDVILLTRIMFIFN